MKRISSAVAVALAAAGLTAITPAAANAVTASGTDPTGDSSLASSYDIVSLNTELTAGQVKITLGMAGAVPQITDSSWAKDIGDGRVIIVSLGDSMQDDFLLDGDGVFASSPDTDLFDDSCTSATQTISGSTITLTADAKCFRYPGKLDAYAVAADSFDPDAGHADVAVAPKITGAISDLSFPDANISPVSSALPGGYYQLGKDGGVFSFGDAKFYGSTGSLKLNSPVVGMAAQASGLGYRFVAGDGGVFDYGDAGFFGSMGGKPLNKPIVGMAATATGKGYWLVASDGGIFAYGDAQFYGSMGGKTLNKPIVSMIPTATGKGYWMVASDGGIFAFGDALFYGSAGGTKLNSPIVGMTPAADGKGYDLLASDGGVFAYGSAHFYGSAVDEIDNNSSEAVSIGLNSTGAGYYIADANGDVFNEGTVLDFGDISRLLTVRSEDLNSPIVGLAVKP